MTVRHPLALTDSQLRIVLDHAAAVPVQWRSRFLESIADQLLPHQQIADDEARVARSIAGMM
jgi:hypothetical protein